MMFHERGITVRKKGSDGDNKTLSRSVRMVDDEVDGQLEWRKIDEDKNLRKL